MKKEAIAKELENILKLILASTDRSYLFKMAYKMNWDAAAEAYIKRNNAKHHGEDPLVLDFKNSKTNFKSMVDLIKGSVNRFFSKASEAHKDTIQSWVFLSLFEPKALELVTHKEDRSDDSTIEKYLEKENEKQKYSKAKDVLERYREKIKKEGDDEKTSLADYIAANTTIMLKNFRKNQYSKLEQLLNIPYDVKIQKAKENLKNLEERLEQAEKEGNESLIEKLKIQIKNTKKFITINTKKLKQVTEPGKAIVEPKNDEDGNSKFKGIIDVEGIADIYDHINDKKYEALRKDIIKYTEDHVLSHISSKDKASERDKELAEVATNLVKMRLEDPSLTVAQIADALDEQPKVINMLLKGALQRMMRSYAAKVYDETGDDGLKKVLDRWRWVDFGRRASSVRLANILAYLDTLIGRLEKNVY